MLTTNLVFETLAVRWSDAYQTADDVGQDLLRDAPRQSRRMVLLAVAALTRPLAQRVQIDGNDARPRVQRMAFASARRRTASG